MCHTENHVCAKTAGVKRKQPLKEEEGKEEDPPLRLRRRLGTPLRVCVHQTRSRTGRGWRAGALSAMKRSGHERGDDLGRGAGVRNRQTRF